MENVADESKKFIAILLSLFFGFLGLAIIILLAIASQ